MLTLWEEGGRDAITDLPFGTTIINFKLRSKIVIVINLRDKLVGVDDLASNSRPLLSFMALVLPKISSSFIFLTLSYE